MRKGIEGSARPVEICSIGDEYKLKTNKTSSTPLAIYHKVERGALEIYK